MSTWIEKGTEKENLIKSGPKELLLTTYLEGEQTLSTQGQISK